MYTIRDACPSDNDALIELEMRCPLDLGEAELVMDRRPDFSASPACLRSFAAGWGSW